MGCVVVPLPLRRRVPGCCRSKLFAPSVAFALAVGARLPLVPAFAGLLTTRPQDSSSYGPTTCSSPKATLSWRFDARVSPPAGHQLRGCLAITRPDFHRQVHRRLQDTHRDSKFNGTFDEIFGSEGIKVIHTPIRALQANAYAERFVRTVRAECLDWLLILGRRHLEHVLRIYLAHYNNERPHRGLALLPPESPNADGQPAAGAIERRDRLGGLIHEYHRAAA